jgi:serine/threonine protein phosphatase PrpC
VGCDGLWDVINPQEAAEIAWEETDIEISAKKLRDLALARYVIIPMKLDIYICL